MRSVIGGVNMETGVGNDCRFCTNMIFDVTNVKFKVSFTRSIHINLFSELVLVNCYRHTKVIHYNNYCYTVFNERFDIIHITGCKCMCLINNAIQCLRIINENDGDEMNVENIKIDSISVKFNVRTCVKNKLASSNKGICRKFVIRHPLQFPGTIIRLRSSNASVTIFNTGKAIGCGFRRYGQIVNFVLEIHKLINDVMMADK